APGPRRSGPAAHPARGWGPRRPAARLPSRSLALSLPSYVCPARWIAGRRPAPMVGSLGSSFDLPDQNLESFPASRPGMTSDSRVAPPATRGAVATVIRRMSTRTAVPDVQAGLPTVHLSLSRVGVTGVEKIIRLTHNGAEQLFSARLECVVDLGPQQKGAHMSRFEETVNDAIGEVVLGEAGFKAEDLARRVAELVRERQDALRAEVTIEARYPEHKP